MTLELLAAIEEEQGVTQRHLASRMGIALGLANSYLKRCIKKGFIKIHQAPANRYLYYLTPQGFSEKSRLTARYLSYSLSFYRKAVESCDRLFADCVEQGRQRFLIYGMSDLGEIAMLRAQLRGLEIVGVMCPECDEREFLNRRVWTEWTDVADFDVCVFVEMEEPVEAYQAVAASQPDISIVAPDVLGLRFDTEGLEEPAE